LVAGAVHVWHDALDSSTTTWSTPVPLSPSDWARAERYKVPARRHAFERGRLFVRHLLGHYLQRPEITIELGVHENGKPFVHHLPGEALHEISLSHSGGVLMVAVSRAGEVGVDAEQIDPQVKHESIARRFFAAEENAALAACSPAEREQAFFRCWTRKEALVKALGDGLAHSLTTFAVSIEPVAVSPLLRTPEHWNGGAPWHLHDCAPGPEYAGALAVRGAEAVVERLRWGSTAD
jgi:4'-phosphopantetheinyl transferase